MSVKSTRRSRENSAKQFECRMAGNTRVMQLSSVVRTRSRIVFSSENADVLNVVSVAADKFPQVVRILKTRDSVTVDF